VSFDPALPKPYRENWREAYRYNEDDTPRLSTFQAPGGEPVPFVFDSIRLSGGQSVDTAEYPFFGYWSNTPLNEKPHAVTVSGFVRGDAYIKNRNALVEALRARTDDDDPGFIDLPLWGRFPVVVVSYDVEEKGKENGQASVSLTLTRAGVTVEERWQFEGGFTGTAALAAKELEAAAVEQFAEALKEGADPETLASAFEKFKTGLLGVIGRIQGAVSTLNKMTNAVTGMASLIAQVIRAPMALAQSLFSAVSGVIAGAMEIKNSVMDTVNYFSNLDNIGNMLLQFFSAANYRLDTEAVTIRQMATRNAAENLYRTMALCAAGQLLVRLEDPTYEQVKSYWALYERLEAAVDQSSPAVYRAVQDMRMAAAGELAARGLDAELVRHIGTPVPLLYLAHYLGCDNEKLRRLNRPADSFVMQGDILHV
jgi:prophage DNA circulation protein